MATNKFFSYTSGILNSSDLTLCPNNNDINHAVLAVGYKYSVSGDNYILFKNSWGPFWGENGYFRFKLENKEF